MISPVTEPGSLAVFTYSTLRIIINFTHPYFNSSASISLETGRCNQSESPAGTTPVNGPGWLIIKFTWLSRTYRKCRRNPGWLGKNLEIYNSIPVLDPLYDMLLSGF